MKVITDAGAIDLGLTDATPTIGIVDFSKRVTDDFGVTTVVERSFARRLSTKFALPFDNVDALQTRLAVLRATAATWVADERFECLSVRGFYKDLSIDVNAPPISFCTLAIEGLPQSQPPVDAGGEPATDGQSSTLMVIDPITIGNGTLSTSVPENEHAQWSAGVAYALNARVIRNQRVWEALAPNTNDDPAALSGKWLDTGPTNSFAMFDQALGTSTVASGSIQTIFNLSSTVDAVAVLDAVADAVRVQVPGYDRTIPVVAGEATLFLDLPPTTGAGNLTVTITGAGQVSVGTLLVGRLGRLGTTERSPTVGITDFSRKETDDFGDTTIVERGWAKRAEAKSLIRTDAIDEVFYRVAAVRARPALWIGDVGTDSLTIYGFYRDFSIEVGTSVSKLSIALEGLSRAAPVSAPGPDRLDEISQEVDDLEDRVDGIVTDINELGETIRLSLQDTAAVVAGGSLTPDRKSIIAKELEFARGRVADLIARAKPLGESTAGLEADFAAFEGYITSRPGWADPNATSPVDPATYNALRTNLFATFATMEAAISATIAQGSRVAEEMVAGNSTITIVGDRAKRSGTATGYQTLYSKRSTKGSARVSARAAADSALPMVIGLSTKAGATTPSIGSIVAGFRIYRTEQGARRVATIVEGVEIGDFSAADIFTDAVPITIAYVEKDGGASVLHQVGAVGTKSFLTTSPGREFVFKALLVGGGSIERIVFDAPEKVLYELVDGGPDADATPGSNVSKGDQWAAGITGPDAEGYYTFDGQDLLQLTGTYSDGHYVPYRGEAYLHVSAAKFKDFTGNGTAYVIVQCMDAGGSNIAGPPALPIKDGEATVGFPIGVAKYRVFIAVSFTSGSVKIDPKSIVLTPRTEAEVDNTKVKEVVNNDGVLVPYPTRAQTGATRGYFPMPTSDEGLPIVLQDGDFIEWETPTYRARFLHVDYIGGPAKVFPTAKDIYAQNANGGPNVGNGTFEFIGATSAVRRGVWVVEFGKEYPFGVGGPGLKANLWQAFDRDYPLYKDTAVLDVNDPAFHVHGVSGGTMRLRVLPGTIPFAVGDRFYFTVTDTPSLVGSGDVVFEVKSYDKSGAETVVFHESTDVFGDAHAAANKAGTFYDGYSIALPAGSDRLKIRMSAQVSANFITSSSPYMKLRSARSTNNQVAIDVLTKPVDVPAPQIDQPPSYYLTLQHQSDPTQVLSEFKERRPANVVGLSPTDTGDVEIATTVNRSAGDAELRSVRQTATYQGVNYYRTWDASYGDVADGSAWKLLVVPGKPYTASGWAEVFSGRKLPKTTDLTTEVGAPLNDAAVVTAIGTAAEAETLLNGGLLAFKDVVDFQSEVVGPKPPVNADKTTANIPFGIAPLYSVAGGGFISAASPFIVYQPRFKGKENVSPASDWAFGITDGLIGSANNTPNANDRGVVLLTKMLAMLGYVQQASTYEGETFVTLSRMEKIFPVVTGPAYPDGASFSLRGAIGQQRVVTLNSTDWTFINGLVATQLAGFPGNTQTSSFQASAMHTVTGQAAHPVIVEFKTQAFYSDVWNDIEMIGETSPAYDYNDGTTRNIAVGNLNITGGVFSTPGSGMRILGRLKSPSTPIILKSASVGGNGANPALELN